LAVRVRLRIERPSGERLECAALLNGGFESGRPEILLPAPAARRLYAQYPAETLPVAGLLAAGETELLELPERVLACVVTPAREGRQARFSVLVSDGADEVLVSDSGIDALGVRIESFGRGVWRFGNERRLRKSARRQHWLR
jgi:hypothetical protein